MTFRCCPAFFAPPPEPRKPTQMTMKAELNPHETELNPHEQSRRLAAAAAQEQGFPCVGGSAGTAAGKGRDSNPVARGTRRPASNAGGVTSSGGACARAYLACVVSGSMEPAGWATQIELIRHGALHSGLRRDARSSSRIADAAPSYIYALSRIPPSLIHSRRQCWDRACRFCAVGDRTL